MQRAQISACVHVFISGPVAIIIEVDLWGTMMPEDVRLTPMSPAWASSSKFHCSVMGKPGIPGLTGLLACEPRVEASPEINRQASWTRISTAALPMP